VLGSIVDGRALWQKLWFYDAKPCTQMQMEQAVFILADISSSDGLLCGESVKKRALRGNL